MNAPINRRIVLASRPTGRPVPQNFALESAEVPQPGPGEVLTRTIWLSPSWVRYMPQLWLPCATLSANRSTRPFM